MSIHPYKPESLNLVSRNFEAIVLRHLVYRIIGGAYSGEIDYIQGRELQVLANLTPQIWNDPRDPLGSRVIDQDLVVFYTGYCLRCKSPVRSIDGTDRPLHRYCGNCPRPINRYELHKTSSTRGTLVNGFSNWSEYHQRECIEFLLAHCSTNRYAIDRERK